MLMNTIHKANNDNDLHWWVHGWRTRMQSLLKAWQSIISMVMHSKVSLNNLFDLYVKHLHGRPMKDATLYGSMLSITESFMKHQNFSAFPFCNSALMCDCCQQEFTAWPSTKPQNATACEPSQLVAKYR